MEYYGKEKKPGGAMSGSAPGVAAAQSRNPNKHSAVNDAPDGPYSHMLGHTDDGGMHGDVTASGKNGEKFHFK